MKNDSKKGTEAQTASARTGKKSRRAKAGPILGVDDEASLRAELRPKDGTSGVGDHVGEEDDEHPMPTGLPRKQGFEDYNPAARPHSQA